MAEVLGLTIKVAIITGQYLVWIGLQTILESSNRGFQVVGNPSQCITSPELLTECRPDVIIIDMETERDAMKSIAQLRESSPDSKVLLLSGFEGKDPVREALEYGVAGVILKIHPPSVMLAAIEASCSPSLYHVRIGGNVTPYVDLRKPSRSKPGPTKEELTWPEAVTDREREVISLVRQGLSNKDIACQLSISDSTVRHHLTSIFDKVGVPNRQKLLVHAHHLSSMV
ncbi:MAG: response regulator transcription factor [Nitrospira sp.]